MNCIKTNHRFTGGFILKGKNMADTNLIYPYEFEGGKKAVASEVNANFEAIKAFSNGVNATFADIKTIIADLKNKPTREMFDVYYSFSAESPIGAYPLWTGETITNCKSLYPQFWKKLNSLVEKAKVPSVTAEEYEEKLETYGQCASFYVDTLNGHVRLPKITRFISSIADLTELAREENAGLPNITGSSQAQDGYIRDSHKASGAISSLIRAGGSSRSGDGGNSAAYFNFDASLSNPIYGASKTVQPPAVSLCLYIQVANNIGEISELDIDVIVTQMNEALTALETSFNNYSNSLAEIYEQYKEDLIRTTVINKQEDILITPEMFSVDNTYNDYPYSAKIVIAKAYEDNVPMVNFELEQRQSGNFAPVAYSGNGFVKIYAKAIPQEEFTIPSIVLQ